MSSTSASPHTAIPLHHTTHTHTIQHGITLLLLPLAQLNSPHAVAPPQASPEAGVQICLCSSQPCSCSTMQKGEERGTTQPSRAGVANLSFPKCCRTPTPIRPRQRGHWSAVMGAFIQIHQDSLEKGLVQISKDSHTAVSMLV